MTEKEGLEREVSEREVSVLIVKLAPHAVLPIYMTPGAAGMDLFAAESGFIEPGRRWACGTGIALQLPAGFEGQVRTRSGTALKQGLMVLNSPGTIDSDYRGEIKAILYNVGSTPYKVLSGQRIAQLVIAPVVRAALLLVDALEGSERGSGGFGSTGK